MEKQIIEIGGVKLEVDMRFAKRLDCLHVGDPVRVMVKAYGDNYNVHSGVVIGFEPFNKLPTILIAYMVEEYSRADIKFLTLNASTQDVEVIAADSEARVAFDKTSALEAFDRQIVVAERAVADLQSKRVYFERHIGTAWMPVTKEMAA